MRQSGWGLLGVVLGSLVTVLTAFAVVWLPFMTLAGFLAAVAVTNAVLVGLMRGEERALAVGVVLGAVLTAWVVTWLPAY